METPSSRTSTELTTATPPRRWREPGSGLPRDALPTPEDGQYYWVDLIGLEVVDETGRSLGTVREMIETGANDVMVIRPCVPAASDRARAEDRIVPFLVGDVVREVDLAAGRIRVSWSGLDDG